MQPECNMTTCAARLRAQQPCNKTGRGALVAVVVVVVVVVMVVMVVVVVVVVV